VNHLLFNKIKLNLVSRGLKLNMFGGIMQSY